MKQKQEKQNRSIELDNLAEKRVRFLYFIQTPPCFEFFVGLCFLFYLDVLLNLLFLLNPVSLLSLLFLRKTKLLFLLLLLLSTCVVFSFVNFSVLYHSIKSQSLLKLYVLYNFIEIVERLCLSFGDVLLPVLLNETNLGLWLVLLGTAWIYYVLHTAVFLFQIMIWNVAVNSKTDLLISLLLSSQIVEIKSAVLKKLTPEALRQLSFYDSRKRFQLLLFCLLVFLHNIAPFSNDLSASSLLPTLLPLVLVVVCETLIDWLKHAFITKFNLIPPKEYSGFLLFLVQQNRSFSSLEEKLDASIRISFPFIQTTAVTLCMLLRVSGAHNLSRVAAFGIAVSFFCCLFLTLKIVSRIFNGLVKHNNLQ